MGFLLLALVWAMLPQEPSLAQDIGEEVEIVPQTEGPLRPLFLPEPISADELDQFSSMLNLSDAQRAFFADAYGVYRDAVDAFRGRELPGLLALSAEAARWGRPRAGGPQGVEANHRYYRERDRVERALRSLEEQMFATLEPVLADAQREQLPRVINMRRRAAAGAVVIAFPTAQVDLARLIFELTAAGDIEPLGAESDEVLAAYEVTLTQLRSAHSSAFLSAAAGPARWIADEAEAQRQRHQRVRRTNSFLRMMIDLNLVYAETLASLMEEDGGERLMIAFREAAFWGIFPDPHNLGSLLDVALDSASDDDHSAIRTLAAEYRARQDELSARMVRAQLAEDRRILDTNIVWGEPERAYRDTLDDLQRQRAENADRTIASLLALLDSDVPEEITAAIAGYRGRVASDSGPRKVGHSYRPGAVRSDQPASPGAN